MVDNKYELTDNTKLLEGHILHQIKALKSFGNVKKGDLGGWIESYRNLSQSDNARVYGSAEVHDEALVCDNAKVHDDAQVFGQIQVMGDAKVGGDLWINGSAVVR